MLQKTHFFFDNFANCLDLRELVYLLLCLSTLLYRELCGTVVDILVYLIEWDIPLIQRKKSLGADITSQSDWNLEEVLVLSGKKKVPCGQMMLSINICTF